jgi:hypothetical protein
MNAADFCSAFCANLDVREVPIGYAIKTPFRRPDGDAIAIYCRRADDGTYRLEDDGQSVGFLEMSGVDLDSETRWEVFVELLGEYDARFDEKEYVIHSGNFNEQNVPSAAVKFSALLLRVFDMMLLSSSRVRNTFKDDLIALVKRQFGEDIIEINAPYSEEMKDYTVDIILRSNDGRALAIFAGTSELKALEALLFWREYRELDIRTVRAMLVLETSKPRELKERTLSRVFNSGLLVASMDGEEAQIRRKMNENLIQ